MAKVAPRRNRPSRPRKSRILRIIPTTKKNPSIHGKPKPIPPDTLTKPLKVRNPTPPHPNRTRRTRKRLIRNPHQRYQPTTPYPRHHRTPTILHNPAQQPSILEPRRRRIQPLSLAEPKRQLARASKRSVHPLVIRSSKLPWHENVPGRVCRCILHYSQALYYRTCPEGR